MSGVHRAPLEVHIEKRLDAYKLASWLSLISECILIQVTLPAQLLCEGSSAQVCGQCEFFCLLMFPPFSRLVKIAGSSAGVMCDLWV